MSRRPLTPANIGVVVAVTFVALVAALAALGVLRLHGGVISLEPVSFDLTIQSGKPSR